MYTDEDLDLLIAIVGLAGYCHHEGQLGEAHNLLCQDLLNRDPGAEKVVPGANIKHIWLIFQNNYVFRVYKFEDRENIFIAKIEKDLRSLCKKLTSPRLAE